MKPSLLRWPVLGCARILGAAATLADLVKVLAMVAHMELLHVAGSVKGRHWITKEDAYAELERMKGLYPLLNVDLEDIRANPNRNRPPTQQGLG